MADDEESMIEEVRELAENVKVTAIRHGLIKDDERREGARVLRALANTALVALPYACSKIPIGLTHDGHDLFLLDTTGIVVGGHMRPQFASRRTGSGMHEKAHLPDELLGRALYLANDGTFVQVEQRHGAKARTWSGVATTLTPEAAIEARWEVIPVHARLADELAANVGGSIRANKKVDESRRVLCAIAALLESKGHDS